MSTSKVVVIIPTYNEKENLPLILDRLFAANSQVDVLVVDDGSPDGTGDIADMRAGADKRIQVLHRTEKGGLGAAYIAGFRWALERGYEVLVEMDADGSHPPETLPRLLSAVAHSDLVIGSRYVSGGKTVNWPLSRQVLSRCANIYVRIALGIGVKDATAGFRAYRHTVLETIDLGAVQSHGYAFQIDLTRRTLLAGFSVAEVPITFTERAIGTSKMSGSIIKEAFWRVAKWGAADWAARLKKLFRRRG